MTTNTRIIEQGSAAFPSALHAMHQTPQRLYVRGDFEELMIRPRVAIVGTRRITPYGRQVTRRLAEDLAQRGIVIVSGLAIGVDAQAHQATLAVGGLTMAVLPSPVTSIAPPSHYQLSEQILRQGGALVSSYPPDQESHKGNFVARNELVAGLSKVVVVTEATANSGTRHTVVFAQDLGVPVMAVPGSITSPTSVGSHNFLRSGAHVVTSANDVLNLLDLPNNKKAKPQGDTPQEQLLLNLMSRGMHDGQTLLGTSGLSTVQFNQTLTMLEITNKILPLGGNQWGIA